MRASRQRRCRLVSLLVFTLIGWARRRATATLRAPRGGAADVEQQAAGTDCELISDDLGLGGEQGRRLAVGELRQQGLEIEAMRL